MSTCKVVLQRQRARVRACVHVYVCACVIRVGGRERAKATEREKVHRIS